MYEPRPKDNYWFPLPTATSTEKNYQHGHKKNSSNRPRNTRGRRILVEFDPRNRYNNDIILSHHITEIYSVDKIVSKVMYLDKRNFVQTTEGEASESYFKIKMRPQTPKKR